MTVRILALPAALLVFVSVSAAQRGGTTTPAPAPSTGTGTAPSLPAPRNTTGPAPNPATFLAGNVVMEDGTPLPERAKIVLVCGGAPPVPEAYTDGKGHFSFQVGGTTSNDRNMMFRDASQAGLQGAAVGGSTGSMPMGTVNLSGCELRADLSGYQSSTLPLNLQSAFGNPEVGTIMLRRLAGVTGTTVSATTLAAPKDAQKLYDKSQQAAQQKGAKPAEIAKDLEKAVQIYPKFAAAWYLLGESRLAMKDESGARKAFEEAAGADPNYISPHMRLASMDLQTRRWAQAAESTDRVLALNPHLAQAQFFGTVANFNLGKMDVAEKMARRMIETPGNAFPRAHYFLGLILGRRGEFPPAAAQYRDFLRLVPSGPEPDQARRQLTEWEGLGVIPRAEAAP